MTKPSPPPRTRKRAPAPRARRRSATVAAAEETPAPSAASLYTPPNDIDSGAFATSPLGVLLAVAHDEALPIALRVQAAKAALPFVHRRMPSLHDAGEREAEDAQEEALAALEEQDAAALRDAAAESACDDEESG
jgi:hypothetical protein